MPYLIACLYAISMLPPLGILLYLIARKDRVATVKKSIRNRKG